MCGIVVALAFGKKSKKAEAIRQGIMQYFTLEMLLRTEDRGRDATGAALLFNDGRYAGLKRGTKASEFLAKFGESKDQYGSLMKVWRENPAPALGYFGHCRQGTGGEKEDNNNNHPIKVGNLIGIHNGSIKNDDIIFKNLGCKRDGQVDSEAIFRLIYHFTNNGKEPFTMDLIQNVVQRLDGVHAVTLFNADNLQQVPIFRDGRPVEFVLLRNHGILFMISEKKFWEAAHYCYERHTFYHGIKLPSLLDEGEVLKDTLADDSAMIFDLTQEVKANTIIKDLGEWKKMVRTDKTWMSNVKTTSYNYKTSNHIGSAATDVKKRRVFDRIKREYVIMAGDKVLAPDASVTVPVDGEDTNASADKSKTASTDTTGVGDEKVINLPEQLEDKEESDNSSSTAAIKDGTDYTKPEGEKKVTDPNASTAPSNVIDAEFTPVTDGNKDVSVVEIEMDATPPAILEAAATAYKDLPDNERGVKNPEDLLEKLSIKDTSTLKDMPIHIMANRMRQVSWKDGYIAALKEVAKDANKNEEIKNRRRERHIKGLKSLILLMSKLFNIAKVNQSEEAKALLEKSDTSLDVDSLVKVFNSHERAEMRPVMLMVGTSPSSDNNDEEQ